MKLEDTKEKCRAWKKKKKKQNLNSLVERFAKKNDKLNFIIFKILMS